MGHARIRGSRGWVTARGHPADLSLKTDVPVLMVGAQRPLGTLRAVMRRSTW